MQKDDENSRHISGATCKQTGLFNFLWELRTHVECQQHSRMHTLPSEPYTKDNVLHVCQLNVGRT